MDLSQLEAEIAALKEQLAAKERQYAAMKLSNDEIARYSRQIILPDVRVGELRESEAICL